MAHEARLKIESKDYHVLECEYEIIQPVKDNGQPAGHPSGGMIHLTVVAPDNTDLFLHEWMHSPVEHKEGEIIFSVVGAAKPSEKNVKFKRAHCVRLYEYFNAHKGDIQMLTKITISPAEFSFGKSDDIVFKNDQK